MKASKQYIFMVGLLITFTLSGCFWKKKSDKDLRNITISVSSGKLLNRDVTNETSPVYLTIYQLSSINTFNDVDFFLLKNNPGKALGANFISRQSFLILPNNKINISTEISKSTQYLGFVAEYSILNPGSWRVVVKIDKDTKNLDAKLKEYTLHVGDS